ncbi:hypothetical protein MF271_21095 (plasmid) [Deinococcus sp. KNUC1210]|uniref:hypothetical protein n=1 Tax=Deinococcus sp. KNUC1210 TaxID=2917691 RepID=UPI001EF00355|nr:hypothetical protein [Deinococcus sp. KNUC1210]ULH17551.1 hypothetical protein MF271_21095 [Deinococcus sp. KNUC1210]
MFYIQAEQTRTLLEDVGRAACRLGDFDALQSVQALAASYIHAVETTDLQELKHVEAFLKTLKQRLLDFQATCKVPVAVSLPQPRSA